MLREWRADCTREEFVNILELLLSRYLSGTVWE
jgi:hypothetical protein